MARTKRWMLAPMTWRRGGAVALVVLAVVAAAALVLDADAGDEYAAIVDRLTASELGGAELVARAGQAARIVVLADVHGQASPKRVAAESIRRLADGPGLDAVLLEVPASEQEYIDAYLTGAEDDAAALLSRPGLVQERYGTPRAYVQVLQAVRAVNLERNPSQRVRVIAGDVEGWPPPEGAPPRAVGERFAGRAEHMLRQLDRELLTVMPEARVLVFVDGYLAMQGTEGVMRFGGGEPLEVEWLGTLLRRRSGADAVTVMVDAGADMGGVRRLPSYHGTTLHRPLRRELDSAAAARVDGALAEVPDPVLELSTPGLTLEILPEGYTLGEAAQGYIFLPGGR